MDQETGRKARMDVSREEVERACEIRGDNEELQALDFIFGAYEPEFWCLPTCPLPCMCVCESATTHLHMNPQLTRLSHELLVAVIAVIYIFRWWEVSHCHPLCMCRLWIYRRLSPSLVHIIHSIYR